MKRILLKNFLKFQPKFSTTKLILNQESHQKFKKLIEFEEFHEAFQEIKNSNHTFFLAPQYIYPILDGFYKNQKMISFTQVFEFVLEKNIMINIEKYSIINIMEHLIQEKYKHGIDVLLPFLLKMKPNLRSLHRLSIFYFKNNDFSNFEKIIEYWSSNAPITQLEVLQNIIKLFGFRRDESKVIEWLNKSSEIIKPTNRQVRFAIYAIYQRDIYQMALSAIKTPKLLEGKDILTYLSDQIDLSHFPKGFNRITFNTLCLENLIKSFFVKDNIYLDKFLQELVRSGIPIPKRSFMALIGYYLRKDVHKTLPTLFNLKIDKSSLQTHTLDFKTMMNQIQEQNIQLKIEHYNLIQEYYLVNVDINSARELFESLKFNNMKLNSQFYNRFIHFHLGYDEFEKAKEYYDDMIKNEVLPDTRVFGNFARYFIKKDAFEKLEWINSEFKSLKIQPNIHYYNVLLNAYPLNKKMEVIEEIEKHGLSFDDETYFNLIQYYIYLDETLPVIKLDKEMEAKKVVKSNETIERLLTFYHRKYRFNEIANLLCYVRDQEINLSITNLNLFLDKVEKKEYFYLILEVIIKTMCKNGFPPNPIFYDNLIEKYQKLEYPEESILRVKSLKEERLKLTSK